MILKISDSLTTSPTIQFHIYNMDTDAIEDPNNYDIKWRNGEAPTFLPGKTYIMSFISFDGTLSELYCNYSVY